MVQLAVTRTVKGAPNRTRQILPPMTLPALRIHTSPAPARAHPRKHRTAEADPATTPRPTIKLQPIVAKPLSPYVLRESACGFLECRAAGRRCLAAQNREVTLGYQVAYCLGPRHESCPYYSRATGQWNSGSRMKKAAYAAAAVVFLALLVAAVAQAVGTGTPVAFGRVVGLG